MKKRLSWLVVGLGLPLLGVARVKLMPGEWRVSAHTAVGLLHRTTCLEGSNFASRVLRAEGRDCRLLGPVQARGPRITVREGCRIPVPGHRAAQATIAAHLDVSAGGRRFAGISHVVVKTPFGTITDHQRIAGVWLKACARP